VHNSQWISIALKVSSMKKVDNSMNFASGRIINHRTHHKSLCRDKNIHQVISYGMVYKAMSVMWHYLACVSSPLLLHRFPKINGGYFPNSPQTLKSPTSHGIWGSWCSDFRHVTYLMVTNFLSKIQQLPSSRWVPRDVNGSIWMSVISYGPNFVTLANIL
jgi:hypothetical protein